MAPQMAMATSPGALDTQTHISPAISYVHKCPEPGLLTSTGLLLHRLNLQNLILGQPGWLSGSAPPSAQGVILETWDGVLCELPAWRLHLPLPVSLPLSPSLSLINK